MKKITFLSRLLSTAVFTLSFVLNTFSQYSFSPSATLIKNQDLNTMTYDSIHILNTSSDTINLNWKLITNDTLYNTFFDFCSSGNCWIGIPDSGGFPPIEPGGFGYAGMHFWTGNTPTTATAKIWVYEKGNPTVGDTLTYILTAQTLGVHENSLNDVFSIGPNPSKGIVAITCKKYKAERIFLYNSTGDLLQTFSPTLSLDLSSFPNGSYFIRVISSAGITSKRILLSR